MTRHLIFLVLILSGCASQKPLPTPKHNTIAELDSYLDSTFTASMVTGTSLTVVTEKGVIYQKSLGFADVADQRAYDEHTIQPIASISKTMIAVALMKAVEKGHLSLDDEINAHLPFRVDNPRHPTVPILISHLITHSSGIYDTDAYAHAYYFNDGTDLKKEALDAFGQHYYDIISRNELVDESYLLEQILSTKGKYYDAKGFDKKPPGTRFHYSNVAATLAAYIIERAVGMSYEAYTRQEIFNPLGMRETFWEHSRVPTSQAATLYYTKARPVPSYQLLTRADGGLMTSTADLGKFALEMMRGYEGRGSLLSSGSYKTMFTSRINVGKTRHMGVFWELGGTDGGFRHDGGDPGVLTHLSYNATKKRTVVMFCNIEATQESHPQMMKLWNAVARFDFTGKRTSTRK